MLTAPASSLTLYSILSKLTLASVVISVQLLTVHTYICGETPPESSSMVILILLTAPTTVAEGGDTEVMLT